MTASRGHTDISAELRRAQEGNSSRATQQRHALAPATAFSPLLQVTTQLSVSEAPAQAPATVKLLPVGLMVGHVRKYLLL